MLKQSGRKIKKILTILWAVFCVVAMTAISVSAAHLVTCSLRVLTMAITKVHLQIVDGCRTEFHGEEPILYMHMAPFLLLVYMCEMIIPMKMEMLNSN